MPAIQPTPVTALTIPPSTTRPLTFDSEADAYLGGFPLYRTQMNDLAANVFANASFVLDTANAIASSAVAASDAATVAQAAANFKGLWSSLSGSLNKPASVKHNGRFWLLLNNLSNVATSEPGVSSDWTASTTGLISQSITSNTTAIPGVRYIFVTAGITLTMPTATPIEGDFNEMVNASGGICFINWSGKKVRFLTPDVPMAFPDKQAIKVSYTTANNGSYA